MRSWPRPGSGDLPRGGARKVFGGVGRRCVAVAEGAEEVLDGDVEGVCEGVPGLEAADGAALFDLDEGASGQATAAGEFVVGPSALAPQPSQLQARRAVRFGSGGKIVTFLSEGADPCPVSADLCPISAGGGHAGQVSPSTQKAQPQLAHRDRPVRTAHSASQQTSNTPGQPPLRTPTSTPPSVTRTCGRPGLAPTAARHTGTRPGGRCRACSTATVFPGPVSP